ncbi:Son of sevenless homolog [Caenorhabditis elegans]|uniref:Son of sevenless homolog n=1 Tax=Caenorhabditis elegans TaxID=6239 RepID=A0A486WXD9_CAEEL|nr:Son of sevenless homolog [Caenorhabditis elegans]VGM69599.1 Son of sevenless homolog [Caenorhabditis elegans]
MSIMSISLHSASSDTVSLTSRRTISTSKHWAAIFDERIYQICNIVHPGLPIDNAAVEHIRYFLQSIVFELIEARATSVVEVDKTAKKLFAFGLQTVCKEAWDNMHQQLQKHKYQKALKTVLESQHRLAAVIKETLGPREKEKKDREKKEIERIACYIYYACESVTEDVLRLTGNYVKNIRNSEQKITMANLDVAMNGDKALMELRTKLRNEEEAESPGGFGFLSEFEEFVAEETEEKTLSNSQTYESVAVDFLRDERRFIRELNRINVFRRRIESVAATDVDKQIVCNLFGNLTEIHDLALKIERTLEDAIELSDTQCIGMGIWEHGEAYEFDTYTFYIRRDGGEMNETRHATYVINDNIKALLESERFASLFQSGEHYLGSSLDGQSFRLAVQYVLPQLLHIPIFHIYQYHEYITRLHQLSSSEEDRRDLNDCRSAFERVVGCVSDMSPELKTKITQFLDQQAKSEKIYNVKRLNEIQSSIDGFTGSPIGKTCNELEKDGDLGMIRPSLQFSSEITKNKKWKTERFVYIFDQMIVLCKRHRNTLKFKDRLAVHSIDVFDIPDSEVTNCFKIESHDKSSLPKIYHFVCKNPEEKRQWMAVLVKVTTKSVLDRILDNHEKEEAKRIPLVVPGPDQYRFSEPDTEDNISFEDYTSSSGIPVIKCGTVLKLIERLTYHSYTDSKYILTFLISYRSFCTPNDLFSLLLERFNIPTPKKLQQPKQGGGPLAGRYDTVQSHGLSAISSSSCINPLCEQKFRKEFQQPIQLRVLSVINQWVKLHWYDFQCDPVLLDALELFLNRCCDPREGLSKQHKKFCKTILALIEKRVKNPPGIMQQPNENGDKGAADEGHVNSAFVFGDDQQHPPQHQVYTNESPKETNQVLWHTAQKGDVDHYDLLTLHPIEIGRQLTLLHSDLYRAIQPIELVEAAWTKAEKWRKSPQLLRLTDHSTLLTYWVSRSIVETESLEERMAMFNRVLEVMSVFEELHNFTGLVAFYSALNSSCIFRLKWCWDGLDNEKKKCFDRFNTLCERRWQEMQKRLSSINPPCIPFFGHYLSNIYFLEQGNSTFVNKSPPHGAAGAQKQQKDDLKASDPENSNKQFKQLVSFLKLRKISNVIREIQIFQDQRYSLTLEPTIRQFFESINPKNDFKSNEDLEEYLYNKSLEIQPKGLDTPTAELKPKHNASTLRSPGVKPPKAAGNHYSANHPIGLHLHSQNSHSAPHAMSSQSSTVPNTPLSAHETKRSLSHNQDDAPLQQFVDIRFERKGTHPKIPVLQPPPLLPRSSRANQSNSVSLPPTTQAPMPPAPKSSGMMSTATSPTTLTTTTTPSSAGGPPPKLHPRRMTQQPMSPLAKSPLTPSRDNSSPSAFQFPVVYEASTAPPLPPRPSTSSDVSSSPSTSGSTSSATKENQEQLRVIFDRFQRRITFSNRPSFCAPSTSSSSTERIFRVPGATTTSTKIKPSQQQQSNTFFGATFRRSNVSIDFRQHSTTAVATKDLQKL